MPKYIWNWNNFKGGIADNRTNVQEGQFAEGVQIDVQTEPNGFKITGDYSTILSTTGNPLVILDLGKFGGTGIYTFCDDGKIYKDTSTTPIYTDVTGSNIISASAMWVSGTLYVYYFTKIGVIHRINLDGTGHTTKGTFDGIGSLPGEGIPVVNVYGSLFYGAGNKFRNLSEFEVESIIYTLPAGEKISAITFFQDVFNIYSNKGDSSNFYDGKKYQFPYAGDAPEYITEWNMLPILGAINIGQFDYVVTGFGNNYSDLYLSSGSSRQHVRSNYDGTISDKKFNGKIVSWKDEIFMLGWNNLSPTSVEGNSVFKYSNYFPGLPTALTDIFKGGTGWTIYSILPSDTNLLIGYSNSSLGTKGVAQLSLDTIPTRYLGYGYIVSPVFDGGLPTEKKVIDEINVSYDCSSNSSPIPHGGQIGVYIRNSGDSSFTQIGSNYSKTDVGNIKITGKQIEEAGIKSSYAFEIKININPTVDNSKSPLIKSVKVFYSTVSSD